MCWGINNEVPQDFTLVEVEYMPNISELHIFFHIKILYLCQIKLIGLSELTTL